MKPRFSSGDSMPIAPKPHESLSLSRADRESALWSRLKRYIQDRLTVLRIENDHPMPEPERNRQVGRIAELKLMESLDEEPVTVPGPHWAE